MENIGYIRSFEVFDDLNDEDIENLLKITTSERYEPEDIIFDKDSTEESMYIVLNGTLEAYSIPKPDKKETLSNIERGKTFGEISFLDGRTRSASIKALEATEVLKITKKDFDKFMETHPKSAAVFYRNLGRILSAKIRSTDSFMIAILDAWEGYYRQWAEDAKTQLERHVI